MAVDFALIVVSCLLVLRSALRISRLTIPHQSVLLSIELK